MTENTTIKANADNDLKFRDTLVIKKPEKADKIVESGSTSDGGTGNIELFTE